VTPPVALVAERDAEDEFVIFYRSEYPATVRLAVVLTYSPEAAEDIAQEAFARVHRRFEALDNPAAYLRVSTVNLCRELHRRKSREWHHLRRLPAPAQSVPLGAGELLDVLARLPERQRTVLVLRYWADWSEAEIAAAVGCRPGTVKSIASRGLATLKKELHHD
jgi:RNA polymerase sigma-70 factor (sigma-E family)